MGFFNIFGKKSEKTSEKISKIDEKPSEMIKVSDKIDAATRIKIVEMKEEGYRSEEIAAYFDLPIDKIYNIAVVESRRRKKENMIQTAQEEKALLKNDLEIQRLKLELEQEKATAELKRQQMQIEHEERLLELKERRAQMYSNVGEGSNGGGIWERVANVVLDKIETDPRNPRNITINHAAEAATITKENVEKGSPDPLPTSQPLDFSQELTEDQIYSFLDHQPDILIREAAKLDMEKLKEEIKKRIPTMNDKNIERAYLILHDGVYIDV